MCQNYEVWKADKYFLMKEEVEGRLEGERCCRCDSYTESQIKGFDSKVEKSHASTLWASNVWGWFSLVSGSQSDRQMATSVLKTDAHPELSARAVLQPWVWPCETVWKPRRATLPGSLTHRAGRKAISSYGTNMKWVLLVFRFKSPYVGLDWDLSKGCAFHLETFLEASFLSSPNCLFLFFPPICGRNYLVSILKYNIFISDLRISCNVFFKD